ncbi:MAG: WG repeat-containing protein [Crocinitomicaceae bacterium]|nr:WG repeat-containing protein [Crocinitomicaceae bacterium]
MKRTVLNSLVLLLIIFSASASYAGNVKKGFVALEMHDYFKAKKAFTKGMKYNPEICSFGLASLYSRDNHVFFSKDSAYRYIKMARTTLYDAKARKRERWAKYGWSLAGIDSLEQIITNQFYAEAKQINTPESYDAFLTSHPKSSYAPRVLAIRDSIAFFSAVMENTSSSYQSFMTSYPESDYFEIAKDNFYEVQFDELTGDGSLASYLEFVQLNANSPLLPAAEKKIFEIVTEENTAQSFDVFIRTYPDNVMIDFAWKQLYQSSLDTLNALTLKRFKSKYPNYPYQKELLRDIAYLDSTFLPIKEGELFGFMNTAGIHMIPSMYQQVSPYSEGLAVVEKNGKYGVIDKYNQVQIPFKFDAISDFMNGRAIVEQDGLQGMIHRNGSFVFECKFDDMGTLSDGLIYAGNGEKFGYYDATGFLRIPMKFTDAFDFSDGVAKVEVDGLEAFIDIYGVYAVPPAFEEIRPYSDSLYIYGEDGFYGFMNRFGKAVIEPLYDEIGELHKGFSIALNDGEIVYLDEAGKIAVQNDLEEFPNFMSRAEFIKGEAVAMKDGEYGKIDQKGRTVIDFKYENLGVGAYIFPFKKKGMWGVMNAAEKALVPAKYSSIAVHEDKYFIVNADFGEGVLGLNGEEIIPLSFESVDYLSNDLFIVESETGFGVLRKGEMIAPLEFQSIQVFGKDYLLLIKSDRWAYLEIVTGKLIEMNAETGE